MPPRPVDQETEEMLKLFNDDGTPMTVEDRHAASREKKARKLEQEARAHQVRAFKLGHWTSRQMKQADRKLEQAEKLRS
jgi:hypothetical protein